MNWIIATEIAARAMTGKTLPTKDLSISMEPNPIEKRTPNSVRKPSVYKLRTWELKKAYRSLTAEDLKKDGLLTGRPRVGHHAPEPV
ncbi:hypothetical protein HY229_08515 [Candidatus Acetothermia bacterium]|nr:hypothetical protein [Candidatus Acetothermia bacterium]MBI3644123.1 hypothetical protein [Candidatus Acetothermia bacterium]